MKKFFILFTLMLTPLLLSPEWSLSAEKSVLVRFHQKPGPSEKAFIRGAKGVIKHAYRIVPAMAVLIDEKEIEKIKKDKKVAYVEEDALFQTSDEYDDAWGVGHIGADVAHASGNKGAGITVAVIDTGIDYNHPDLGGNYAGGYDFVFDDADPFDDNYRSHGTHVAGIIGAESNGTGVVGVAPEVDLYALKVLDGAGFGLASWVIAALDWCVMNGIDIANLSLEGPDVQALHDACDNAYDAGVLLVAAAGNTNGGSVKYPGAYGSVIAVTGTNASDMKAYFSPVGPEVEIAAPGLDILSTIAGSAYGLLSGTSQASPHVAGTAALFMATDPQDENDNGMINDEVRELLRSTAIDLGDAGFDTTYGYGLVNAATALFETRTLITLSAFCAKPGNARITLYWETESETENAGFSIYRSVNNGEYEQVNAELIPAEGSPMEGAVYRFVDNEVQNRTRYTYILEDVDFNGAAVQHGPVRATPRLIYDIGR